MDVSPSILEDPKFRLLGRRHSEIFALAFTTYMSTMAASWREGSRATVEEAWPPQIPYDDVVVDALREVLLA